jgi:hypothetical protein
MGMMASSNRDSKASAEKYSARSLADRASPSLRCPSLINSRLSDQFVGRLPEQAVDAVANDFDLASAAVDQGDRACGHRLDRGDAEVLELLRMVLGIFPVPLGMPE